MTEPWRWTRRAAIAAVLACCVADPLWAASSLTAVDPSQADDPLAVAEDLVVSGRHAEAQAAASKAQRLYEAKGDRHRAALSILLLATAERGLGRFDLAANDFARSAATLEEVGDRFGAWMALGELGNLERLRRRPIEALARFEQSLGHLRAIAGSTEPFSPWVLKRLCASTGVLRRMQGKPEPAKAGILRLAEAMSRAGIVGALLDSGRLAQAEDELTRVTELARPLAGALDGELAILRGELRLRQGVVNEAREIFVKLLDNTEAEKDAVLGFLTAIELSTGRLEAALAWNDKALALTRDSEEESAVLLLRAEILERSHRSEEAAKTLGAAMEAAQRSGSGYQQALVHQELGTSELDRDSYERAAAHFESAARLFGAAGQPEREALTWLQLFQVYSELGSRAAAAAALDKVRALSGGSKSHLLAALADFVATSQQVQEGKREVSDLQEKLLNLLALPELREGQKAEEGQDFSRMLADLEQGLGKAGARSSLSTSPLIEGADRFGRQDMSYLLKGFDLLGRDEFAAAREVLSAALALGLDRDLETVALVGIGISYLPEGNGEEAIRYLIQAVAAIEKGADEVKLEELLAGYLGSRQDLFSILIEALARSGRSEEAFEYTERARARAFLQGLGNRRIDPRAGADAELAREAEEERVRMLAIERRAVSAPGDAQLTTELQLARERYESLRLRLKVTNPDRDSRVKVEPQTIAAIREELGPDTTLISYFVSPVQAHVWVLDREALHYVMLPFTPQDLSRAVCWAEAVGRRAGSRGASHLDSPCGGGFARAEEIYAWLIAPLRGWLRHRRLIVIPHGELHYLPFAALRDPQSGRYLIEDYALTYAPSASVLGFLHRQETPVEGRALILGAPEELDPKLTPLPAARREAGVVARLFGTRPWLGAQATESRLANLSGAVDLLHIAAHGFYESRSSLFSHLALAPGPDHDGNLEVHEIFSDLDLSGVNLVVLSACETARGERSKGDEITSLARAFLSAGSPAVISTLWSIDDVASAVLMKGFYRRLLAGAPVAEALREAQLALLRKERYRQPYYWAAFGLTGHPQAQWHIEE